MKILALTPRIKVDVAGVRMRVEEEVKAFGRNIDPELFTDLGLIFYEGHYYYAALYDQPDPEHETFRLA